MPREKLEAGEVELGPAMAALTEKQRRFVTALFEAPKSHGAGVFAARAAGYGTSTSSRQSIAQMAYSLMHDPKVEAAVAEVSKQHLTVLGPHAVRALRRVLDNPGHRDHGRALGIIFDRVAPQQSTHTMNVNVNATPSAEKVAASIERIAELAAKFGVALPAPKVIEGRAAA